jgi:hypothetical protein
MRPNEHLDWLRESVDWFLALDPEADATPTYLDVLADLDPSSPCATYAVAA